MRRLALVLLAAVTFAAGCSRCGGKGGGGGGTASTVRRVLPKGALVSVVVPDLGKAGQKLKLLEGLKAAGFAAQLRGFPDGKGFADALVAELGLDVRSPEALAQAGVDASRSAGAAVVLPGHVLLALPVKDAGRLHHTLETLATRRLGAGAGGETSQGGVTVRTFSPQQGQPARLAYALAHGYALVAEGEAAGAVTAAAGMGESDALSSDAAFEAHLARLPKERDLVVYFPTGSPALARAPFGAALAAVSLSAEGLAVHLDAPWKGDPAQLALLQPQRSGGDLLGYLPADAFLVARFSGDAALLGPWVKELAGPYLGRAFDEGGFDVKSLVLDQLEPGAVAALSLADRPPLGEGVPSLDLRQTNPFAYAHLSGVARVKTAAAVVPTLEKVIELAPRFGAQMVLKQRPDGQKAVLTTYSQGEGVHVAPKGDLVFFASPVTRLDALVKSDGKGALAVRGLADEAVTVAVDLHRLAASVRELPESAWGLGGFAIKGTTLRWLEATDDLEAITLSVGAKGGAVQARVLLSFVAPTGKQAP